MNVELDGAAVMYGEQLAGGDVIGKRKWRNYIRMQKKTNVWLRSCEKWQ